MHQKQFLFTVIIPVYNVAQYLGDAIDSILEQTIGFSSTIQLILVNDGSTDRSGLICNQYQQRFPDNIVCIEKENGGAASARNAGIPLARGRYVTFLDGDDIWSKDAFRQVAAFFSEHPKVRVAAGRIGYLDRFEGRSYQMDYVHRKTRVINIQKKPDMPLFSLPRVFFAADVLKGHSFDETLAFSEDGLLLNTIILEEGRFGVVREAVYYIRGRYEESSATDRIFEDRHFYQDVPEKVFCRIMDRSRQLYGSVIPYCQYVLITYMRFRLFRELPAVLDENERKEYLNTIRDILNCIDDQVILSQKNTLSWRKVYELKVKHGIREYEDRKDLQETLLTKEKMHIGQIDVDGETMMIRGTAREKWVAENSCMFVQDEQGNRTEAAYSLSEEQTKEGLFPDIGTVDLDHVFALPLRDGGSYRFWIDDGSCFRKQARIICSGDAGQMNLRENGYAVGEYIIREEDHSITVIRKRCDE